MIYSHKDDGSYLLNLVDTPGHVDFSSELLRSLLSCQGAVLLVDAGQGIQAQTLSVLDEAISRGLTVVGAGASSGVACRSTGSERMLTSILAVNKWDLVKDDGRGEAAVQELSDLLGCDPSEILRISAKTGWGVESVLEAIVERIPPPPSPQFSREGELENLRALAFDSWYDSFRGVVSLVSVHEGELRKGQNPPTPAHAPKLGLIPDARAGDSITSTTTGKSYPVLDIGIMSPGELSIATHPDPASRVLRKGMVGWFVCGMKDPKEGALSVRLLFSR